jgi:hypothetical protein
MQEELEKFKVELKRQVYGDPLQVVKDYIEKAAPKAGDTISSKKVFPDLYPMVLSTSELTKYDVIEKALNELSTESIIKVEGEIIIRL